MRSCFWIIDWVVIFSSLNGIIWLMLRKRNVDGIKYFWECYWLNSVDVFCIFLCLCDCFYFFINFLNDFFYFMFCKRYLVLFGLSFGVVLKECVGFEYMVLILIRIFLKFGLWSVLIKIDIVCLGFVYFFEIILKFSLSKIKYFLWDME